MIIMRKKGHSEAPFGNPVQYLLADSGNVALVFGLSASVILACMGAAIDFGRIVSAKSSLQSGVDAAALAARNSAYKTDSDLTGFAND